ncbi:hypothetical protein KW787_02460 [Candidatus Pacearchaeota archaeon]|nr:hypothetical protein [Candidatus Pacearchaeota archaeon]
MKKSFGLLFSLVLSAFVLTVIFAHPVAAGPVEDINSFIDGIIRVFGPIIGNVLGQSALSSDLFFAKFLLVILIFTIVWASLSNITFFNQSRWILIVISVVVSLLGARGLGDAAWIQAILLPYNTLFIAISVFLPFVIYFFFVYTVIPRRRRFARRMAWVVFAVIFIGLWFARYDQLQAVKGALWLYPAIAFAALIMIVLDGTVVRIFGTFRNEWREANANSRFEQDILDQMNTLRRNYAAGSITFEDYERQRRNLQRRLDNLNNR